MEKLKVGHFDYSVEDVDNLRFGDDDINGICLADDKEIKLDAKLNEESRKGILIHEVTHALFHESGLGYIIPEEDNEEYAILLSNILHGFLKDNIEQLYEMYK